MAAVKLVLCLSIGFIAMSALRASPAAVARVDEFNRHTGQLSLVFDAVPQVRETPVAESATKRFANRWLDAVPNTFQVFQCDTAAECLCFRHQLLAYLMVRLPLKPALSAGHEFQAAFSILRPLSLVLFTSRCAATAVTVDQLARELLSCAICCDVGDSKVNAKECINIVGWILRYISGRVQIECSIAINKIGLSLHSVQIASEILAGKEWHNDPAVHSQQTNAVDALKRECAFVICDSTEWLELRTYCLVVSEALDGFADSSHGGLARYCEPFAQVIIAASVTGWLREHTSFKSYFGCVISGSVECFHVGQQCRLLCRVSYEFESDYEFHFLDFRTKIILKQDWGNLSET